jgi:hypothetical protein
MKYNIYKISNCDFVGTIEFEECKEVYDILDLDEGTILSKFEPLFEKYDAELFENRFDEDSWFILINAETLKPECEIDYFINDGAKFVEISPNVYKSVLKEDDIEFEDVLIDIPEHDTRATFFNNLYERFVNLKGEI